MPDGTASNWLKRQSLHCMNDFLPRLRSRNSMYVGSNKGEHSFTDHHQQTLGKLAAQESRVPIKKPTQALDKVRTDSLVVMCHGPTRAGTVGTAHAGNTLLFYLFETSRLLECRSACGRWVPGGNLALGRPIGLCRHRQSWRCLLSAPVLVPPVNCQVCPRIFNTMTGAISGADGSRPRDIIRIHGDPDEGSRDIPQLVRQSRSTGGHLCWRPTCHQTTSLPYIAKGGTFSKVPSRPELPLSRSINTDGKAGTKACKVRNRRQQGSRLDQDLLRVGVIKFRL